MGSKKDWLPIEESKIKLKTLNIKNQKEYRDFSKTKEFKEFNKHLENFKLIG